jgi:tRNA/rRNA methyltransferase
MKIGVKLDNIVIVLNKPKIPENIGASARAVCNMGMQRLFVVSSQPFDLERVLKMATHGARHIIDSMAFFDSLDDALKDFQFVVGTTARKRGIRRDPITPREMAEEIVSISQNNHVAILFGPEDRGLTNEEIGKCDRIVTIPTSDFKSLNLAQAVMVICYEIFTASNQEPLKLPAKWASFSEKEGMFQHLKETLLKIGVIQPENSDYWMSKVKASINRVGILSKEVQLIRGICRQIDWYANKKVKEALKGYQEWDFSSDSDF